MKFLKNCSNWRCDFVLDCPYIVECEKVTSPKGCEQFSSKQKDCSNCANWLEKCFPNAYVNGGYKNGS